MYEVQLTAEVQEVVRSLHGRSLHAFTTFVAALGVDPMIGRLYRPGGDMRTEVVDDGELLVVWLVPDDRRAVLIDLVWLGDTPSGR